MTRVCFDHSADIEEKIQKIEAETGIEYAQLQKKAIRQSDENDILILTGGPGTGKRLRLTLLSLF